MNQMTENEPPDDKIQTSLMTQDAHFPNLHLGGSYLARKPVWGTVQPVISQNMSSNKGIFMKRFIKMVLGEGLAPAKLRKVAYFSSGMQIFLQGFTFTVEDSLRENKKMHKGETTKHAEDTSLHLHSHLYCICNSNVPRHSSLHFTYKNINLPQASFIQQLTLSIQ